MSASVKLVSLKADLAKEQEGGWIPIPELPGVELLVRSIHYRPFVVARDAASRRMAKRYGVEPVPPEEEAQINGALYADHLLLGWKGFDQPHSPELARGLMTDVAYRELRGHVVYAAVQVGRADVEFLEDARKNSEAPSAGA